MVIVIEREKIYEEVWNEKMKDVAKKYNISEASLRKYCRQLKVPFPQSGYWTKVKNGNTPKKTYLPEFHGDNKVIINKQEYDKKDTYTKDNRLKHMTEKEKSKIIEFCNGINVSNSSNKTHHLLKETKFYYDKRDMFRDGRSNNLNMKVSIELKNRAIRIMDTIFKSVEKLGFQVKSKDREIRICKGSEEVRIGLKEKLFRSDHIKTDKESYWSPQYDYKYSGELQLFIDEYCAPRKNWRDLSNTMLEDVIGDFIIAIIDTTEILRQEHEIRMAEAEIARKKEIAKRKLKKEQEYELKKIGELRECTENYILSTKIDKYIKALEENLDYINDEEKRNKISKYIDWAKNKSQWLNPIIQKEDKVLGRKYDDKLYDIEFQDNSDEYLWPYY